MNAQTRRTIEKTFAAVAFTDVGEHETAIRMAEATEKPRRLAERLLHAWENHMSAIAYAEAGEHEEARRLIERKHAQQPFQDPLSLFLEKVGLEKTRVCYGVLSSKS